MLLSKPCSFDADILYKGICVVQNANYLITCCAQHNGIWTSVVNIHSHRTSIMIVKKKFVGHYTLHNNSSNSWHFIPHACHCTIHLHQMKRTWITEHHNICYCNYAQKLGLEKMLMGHYQTKYCTDIKYIINTTCLCTFIPVYFNRSLILLLHYVRLTLLS